MYVDGCVAVAAGGVVMVVLICVVICVCYGVAICVVDHVGGVAVAGVVVYAWYG